MQKFLIGVLVTLVVIYVIGVIYITWIYYKDDWWEEEDLSKWDRFWDAFKEGLTWPGIFLFLL